MNLTSLQSKEHITFIFKSIYEVISNTTNIAQTAFNNYSDLQDAFDRRVVIAEEYNGRQTQNINISTTFGDDIGGLASKEFRFLYGSTLKYDRVLPANHRDTSEVVNLQTLLNILLGNSNDVGALDLYLRNDGGLAKGSYHFTRDPAVAGQQSITIDGIQLFLVNGASIATPNGTVDNVTSNPLSLVNRQFVENLTPQTQGIKPQPIFTSGKIAINSTNDQEIIKTFGKYNIEKIDKGTYSFLKIKLLKLNQHAAWDNSDKTWIDLFGANALSSIPGYENVSPSSRIPVPVDYDLYVEYKVIDHLFVDTTTRVRTKILDNNYSVIIDSDGDLSLIFETNYTFKDPYHQTDINLNCNGSLNPLLFLVVRKWSYLSQNNNYIDYVSTTETPTLIFNNKVWMRDGSVLTDITIRYRLTLANVPTIISWSHDSSLTITFGNDSAGYYADILFPTGNSTYNIKFTASFTLNSVFQTLERSVNLQLKDYEYNKIQILTNEFYFNRWDLNPSTLPVTLNLLSSGGEGVKTWSIIADSDTTLDSATINSSTGIVEGNYITPDIDTYVKVKVQDATYNSSNSLLSRSGTITSVGTAVTLNGGDTTTGLVSGDKLVSGAQTQTIQSITNATQLVLVSAFSPDLTNASYSISKGTISTNSTIATLSGTLTTSTISPGDYIGFGLEFCRVNSITSSTIFILESSFTTDLVNQHYSIIKGQCISKVKIHVSDYASEISDGGIGVIN